MDLAALIQKQISADRRRKFMVEFNSEPERVAQLEKDLVGLLGEIGEFANALKKVRLALDHTRYQGPTLGGALPDLREELADAFIYLMRISAILGGDLEADVMKKMRLNDQRYDQLE